MKVNKDNNICDDLSIFWNRRSIEYWPMQKMFIAKDDFSLNFNAHTLK